MTSKDIVEAIFNLDPKAEFVLKETDIAGIEWKSTPISVSDIEAELEQLPAKREAAEQAKATQKAALLAKLGITEEEAKLLLA